MRSVGPPGILFAIAVTYPFMLLLLTAQQVFLPQRNGPLALAQILAPHLTLLATLLLPHAVLRPRPADARAVRFLRVGMLALLAVGVVRFGPGLVSLPASPPPDAPRVSVLSWNLNALGPGVGDLTGVLLASSADVVGLQELRRSVAGGLEADPRVLASFPYMILRPNDGSTGIGLLSRHPFRASGWVEDPSAAWATLDLGNGRTLVAVTAHPLPARIPTLGSLPVPIGIDATSRDLALIRLRRDVLDPLAAEGHPIVFFGDFNVTDREPGYSDLVTGLRDAHADVGLGPGSTWRPPSLQWLPLGLIRIDHVFTGPTVAPVWIEADCTPRGSDHCILYAEVALATPD